MSHTIVKKTIDTVPQNGNTTQPKKIPLGLGVKAIFVQVIEL